MIADCAFDRKLPPVDDSEVERRRPLRPAVNVQDPIHHRSHSLMLQPTNETLYASIYFNIALSQY